MNTKYKVLFSAMALTFGMSAQAGTIDLFTEVSGPIKDTIVDGIAVEGFATNAASIIGGERDTSVNLIQDDLGFDPGNGTRLFIGGGNLSFSNDDGAGGEAIVQWDGVDGSLALDPIGLQDLAGDGIDLRAAGETAFIYDVISTDIGFMISIEAYTDATHFTKAIIKTDNVGIEAIAFDNLENGDLCGYDFAIHGPIMGIDSAVQSVDCGGTFTFGNAADNGDTVDFADLGALQIKLNAGGGQTEVDLRIGAVKTVPEPSVIALLGMGLLGFSLAGRKGK